MLVLLLGTSALADDQHRVPSWGSGPTELVVFSDYFCTPCQKLEPELEALLETIMAEGAVKVIFADLPIYRLTPLYNRYFLYAAYAGADYRQILKARRILFYLADRMAGLKEEHLANAFRADGVAFIPFDTKPVQASLNAIIREYKAHATPTCVVKYGPRDIRTYRGGKEIVEGLKILQKDRSQTKH